jgi:integrase/recombinase XerD
MVWSPCLIRLQERAGALSVALRHPLLHGYREFVAARLRRETLLATAYDLKAAATRRRMAGLL